MPMVAASCVQRAWLTHYSLLLLVGVANGPSRADFMKSEGERFVCNSLCASSFYFKLKVVFRVCAYCIIYGYCGQGPFTRRLCTLYGCHAPLLGECPKHHELLNAHGFTIVTLSLCGWEVFPTPGALTNTKITWPLSTMAPQVPNVTPRSPLYPWRLDSRMLKYSPIGVMS